MERVVEGTKPEPGTREEHYGALVEGLTNGVVILRLIFEAGVPIDFELVDANQAFTRQVGVTNVIGKRMSEVFPTFRTSEPGLLDRYLAVVQTGVPSLFDINPAATGRWLTVSAYRSSSDHVVAILEDFTDRKLSESRFSTAFHSGPVGMSLVRISDTRYLEVNDRLAEITGFSREEMIGKTPHELGLLPQHVVATMGEAIRATGGAMREFELELVRKNGEIATVLGSAQLIDLDGVPTRLVTTSDITARKHAERRLATQHAVSRVLARATSLATAASELVQVLCEAEGWELGFIWELDGGVMRCVDVWHRPDLVADALVAQTRALTFASGIGGPGRVWSSRQPAIIHIASDTNFLRTAAALELGFAYAIEFPIVHGDRVVGVVDVLARRIRSRDPQMLDMFSALGAQIGQFVERVRAERELRELNAELERRVADRTAELELMNRELESFSSSVSHDLRAPLRAINGYARMLGEDFAEQLPADARGMLDRIAQNGLRMGELIEDLMRLARYGRQSLEPVALDTAALVHGVVEEQRREPTGNPVEIHIGELGSCRADASLLRQVWTNLISNALKYSRDRNPARIEIGRVDGAYFVRDNGVGFESRDAPRLFGVFQRLHPADDFEGTGIGLAIVERIVRRHGGRVWAESVVGSGSTFWFTLAH